MPLIITPGQLSQRGEFYHQVSTMLTAGLTLPQALEQTQRNSPRTLRPQIKRLLRCLEEGCTFTEAVAQLGRWMPSFDAALLEAGETSGRLDQSFRLLSTYYSERARMARQTISDLLYPVFLVHFAALVFPFITWFASGDTVGFITTELLVLRPLWGGSLLLVWACQGRHGERWRSMIESVLNPVPMLGTARRYLALARLSAALEALLSAGVGIIESWELAAAACGSPEVRRTVLRWKNPLASGTTPSELVSRARVFPEMFAGQYHAGEISGKLDECLLRLHGYYQEEGSRKLQAVAKWSPKMLYMGVMVVIAWKIISFYTGYFAQLNKAMNFN
jgi:type II secretory pathway component PulF